MLHPAPLGALPLEGNYPKPQPLSREGALSLGGYLLASWGSFPFILAFWGFILAFWAYILAFRASILALLALQGISFGSLWPFGPSGGILLLVVAFWAFRGGILLLFVALFPFILAFWAFILAFGPAFWPLGLPFWHFGPSGGVSFRRLRNEYF